MKKSTPILATILLSASFATAQEDYSTAWDHHTNVVLNTTGSGAGVFTSVHDFPVLVRLDTSNFDAGFSEADENGADIRFTKADDETRLPHQIETWDAEAGTAAVWVLVDTVMGNRNNQNIRMHWGNGSAADSSDGEAVFDTESGFAAVWHLGGDADESDATANALTAVQNGAPASVAGVVGGARSFDGAADFLDVENSDSLLNFPVYSNYSVSAWVNLNGISSDGAVVSKGDFSYALKLYREASWEFFEYDGSAWNAAVSSAFPEPGVWVHLLGVQDEFNTWIYVNGVLDNPFGPTSTAGGGGRDETFNVTLGREPQGEGGRRYLNGIIDEARVHGVSRGADWARLEYQNQRPAGQTLVQLSDTIPDLDTTGVPAAPTAVTAALGSFAGQASVSWTAPEENGGSPITDYVVTADPDDGTCTTTGATTCSVSGLTPDSTYSFTVQATNAVGTGPASEPSDTLTIPVNLKGSLLIQVAGNRNPFVFRMPSDIAENTESLTLSIVDMSGRTIWSRTVNPSRDEVSEIAWNGKTATGSQASAGMYVVQAAVTERGKTTRHNLKGVTLAPR